MSCAGKRTPSERRRYPRRVGNYIACWYRAFAVISKVFLQDDDELRRYAGSTARSPGAYEPTLSLSVRALLMLFAVRDVSRIHVSARCHVAQSPQEYQNCERE